MERIIGRFCKSSIKRKQFYGQISRLQTETSSRGSEIKIRTIQNEILKRPVVRISLENDNVCKYSTVSPVTTVHDELKDIDDLGNSAGESTRWFIKKKSNNKDDNKSYENDPCSPCYKKNKCDKKKKDYCNKKDKKHKKLSFFDKLKIMFKSWRNKSKEDKKESKKDPTKKPLDCKGTNKSLCPETDEKKSICPEGQGPCGYKKFEVYIDNETTPGLKIFLPDNYIEKLDTGKPTIPSSDGGNLSLLPCYKNDFVLTPDSSVHLGSILEAVRGTVHPRSKYFFKTWGPSPDARRGENPPLNLRVMDSIKCQLRAFISLVENDVAFWRRENVNSAQRLSIAFFSDKKKKKGKTKQVKVNKKKLEKEHKEMMKEMKESAEKEKPGISLDADKPKPRRKAVKREKSPCDKLKEVYY